MQYISLAVSLSRLGVEFPAQLPATEHSTRDQNAAHDTHSAFTNHAVDPADDFQQELFRRIRSAGIDLIGCVALLIKAQWERHHQTRKRPDVSNSLDLISDKTRVLERQTGFTSDCDAIFQLFENEKEILATSGYDAQSFRLLCNEMTSARLFWGDIDSPELEAFRQREQKNHDIFSNASNADVQPFRRKKLFWLEVYDQLGEKILILEELKLRCEEVNRRFMVEFGEAYLALEEQLLRIEEGSWLIEYCRSNPAATQDEIENVLTERAAARQYRIGHLKHSVFIAPYLAKQVAGVALRENDFLDYRTKVKRRLLEIRMILHPDRLAHHPRYGELSVDQRERLEILWHQIQEITPVETGYADNQVGGTLRSLSLLENTLNEAKGILAHPGIDTDVQLIPQGDTLEEQIVWLDTSIDWIDGQTVEVVAEINALTRDEVFRKREALLASAPEVKTQVREEMVALARETGQEADEIERELGRILVRVEHDNSD